ncbi:MAG: SH3 domain-containing protein [Anaerolineales bacterium]|nr:SH3 domain-containing protein [Anaerolineales bacterium]
MILHLNIFFIKLSCFHRRAFFLIIRATSSTYRGDPMPFSPVNYSQGDPAWKSVKIGSSSETIGHVGCALTSLAMLVSGHGYPETPKTLNAKLKARGGYVDAAIIWGAVTSIYPQIVYRNLVLCRDTAAPLARIDASIAAGQPVLVEVDSSPQAGLQTHWVVLYAKQGDDYLMLDPWPHPTESGQEVPLMPRYSHGKALQKSITAVVFYECLQSGTGDSGDTATTKPTSPTEPGTYVKIPVSVEAGLRLRTAPTTASDTVAIEPPGALLRIVEPVSVALPKIGVYDQWLKVRDGQGREGYVAAWYVEAGPTVEGTQEPPIAEPAPTSTPEPTPEPTPPVPVPTEPVSENEGEPEHAALTVYVSQSVGEAGLRLRKTASLGGALVAIEKAGAALTVLEPADKARAKVGKQGKWIHVSDPERLQGYVAADYVELKNEPVLEEPVVTPEPVAEAGTVYVSSAAAAGLRLRSEPNTNSDTLAILPPGTELKVLEGTAKMIGVYGKWFKVRETGGTEGYVAAWYLRK